MRETDNIFDTSTTLLDIDEPAAGDTDARPHDEPRPDAGGEPDYFTPNPAIGHADARRRALAVLGLVGGGIFMAVLISAATGSGESPATTSETPTSSVRPAGGRSATVVAPKRAPRARPQRAPTGRTRTRGAHKKHRSAENGGKADASAHRRRDHSPTPQRSAPPPPPPEPTYTPEPEPTYVPVEETAPPPPSSSPSSGGAQQEFGFEP